MLNLIGELSGAHTSIESEARSRLHTQLKGRTCSSDTSAMNAMSPCPICCSSSAAMGGLQRRARPFRAQCTRISNLGNTRSSWAGRATVQRSCTWRCGKINHISFACCRTGCWATCGPNACAAGNGPNSGCTGWSSTNWNCGATVPKRSSSAASALLTSTGRGPICRSRPTAITPRPACSGISTGTTAKL